MNRIKSSFVFFAIVGLFLLNSLSTFGQNTTMINLNDLLNSPESHNELLTSSEVEELETLVYDLNPTIFISDSGAKILGNGAPVTAELSASSFGPLQTSNPDFGSVKLLKIKIEKSADLNKSLDLSSLSGFQDLKYVFVQCAINCSFSRIQNMFSNTGDVNILYIIATPK